MKMIYYVNEYMNGMSVAKGCIISLEICRILHNNRMKAILSINVFENSFWNNLITFCCILLYKHINKFNSQIMKEIDK